MTTKKKPALKRLSGWARNLKQDILTVYFALRDPRCPWHARILAAALTAYAFSPIDLIPDFIPVLGYLDEMVLLPVGIWLVLRLIPESVLTECRRKATEHSVNARSTGEGRLGLLIILGIWATAVVWTLRALT
jgi:uncharacterized membrane protein YkvA (DUF1232 family)